MLYQYSNLEIRTRPLVIVHLYSFRFRLSEFLTNNIVISDTQFRFRRKCNATLTVFYFVADLLKSVLDKTYYVFVFLDLHNAFDPVNVEILAKQLTMYGICGTASFSINSYLSNKDQYVVCDECKSDVLPVDVGIPQRSVIGPPLFNISKNDISQLGMKIVIFADDAVFYAEAEKFFIN